MWTADLAGAGHAQEVWTADRAGAGHAQEAPQSGSDESSDGSRFRKVGIHCKKLKLI
jgi:hypothetical protein